MLAIRKNNSGVIFKVYVQTRASKNQISGLHGDALKVRLTAPPVDGAANRMCIEYLAKCLALSKKRLAIKSGLTSRTKQVLVQCPRDVNLKAEQQRLTGLIQSLIGPEKSETI